MAKIKQAPEQNDGALVEKKLPKWAIGKDEATVAKIQAKKDARKGSKRDAIDTLVAFVKAYGPADAQKAASRLFSVAYNGERGPRESTGRVTSAALLLSLFPGGVGTSISEMDVFTKLQLGRAEMRTHSKRAIKQASDPSQRIWVQLDFATKSYTLVAIGADAPDGWIGYRPSDETSIA